MNYFEDNTVPAAFVYADTLIGLTGLDDMATIPLARRIVACPCCGEPQESERWCRYCGTDIETRKGSR